MYINNVHIYIYTYYVSTGWYSTLTLLQSFARQEENAVHINHFLFAHHDQHQSSCFKPHLCWFLSSHLTRWAPPSYKWPFGNGPTARSLGDVFTSHATIKPLDQNSQVFSDPYMSGYNLKALYPFIFGHSKNRSCYFRHCVTYRFFNRKKWSFERKIHRDLILQVIVLPDLPGLLRLPASGSYWWASDLGGLPHQEFHSRRFETRFLKRGSTRDWDFFQTMEIMSFGRGFLVGVLCVLFFFRVPL